MSENKDLMKELVQQGREIKNSVFQGSGPEQQFQVSQQDYAKRELGFEIPVGTVPLPSKGKIYTTNHSLHMKEFVDYRGMTTKEEDLLMSPVLAKKGTMISDLIKSCLIDKSIDVTNLLSGDRNALMLAIRSFSYGNEYRPGVECPKCEVKNEDWVVDLEQLDIKPLELEPLGPGMNLFYFTLPNSKKTIGFKFLTGGDEEKIMAEIEMKKKKGIQNTGLITTRLLHSIVEFEGSSDRGLISRFVQYMPSLDSRAFRDYYEKHEPGVDMDVDFLCHSCEHYEKISMPFTKEFFFPGNK